MGAAAQLVALALLCWLAWLGNAQQQSQQLFASALNGGTNGGSSGSSSTTSDMDHFVRVESGQFVVDCKRFYVAGWNQWELVEAAAGALELFGASLPPNTTGPALVRRLLDRAAANKFNVMRTWTHTVTEQYALQTSPGQYNEAVFRGLDYALDEARKRGIRLLLSLTDNWQQVGGADEFVRWAGSGDHESFFTNPTAKQLYKQHVAVVLRRVNSINGRRYSEDPTIFGWNLINEPRCYRCGNELELWVREMAGYVKSLDSSHLLTVGEEGFYPAGLLQSAANPQGVGSWATLEGQNFLADHASPDIDFTAIHLWVNNWEDMTPEFVQRWIRQHVVDSQTLGKPLILEEFGVWGGNNEEQRRFYKLVYDAISEKAKAAGPAQGALFWTWYAEGQKAPAEEGGSASGLYGVFESNGALWSIIQGFSHTMRSLSGMLVPGCSNSRTAQPAAECTVAGYEGPRCDVDINECARQTAGCDPAAACINQPGSFTCRCFDGYSGDGTTSCQPTEGLSVVERQYFTEGTARLACNEGTDVSYPESAPGFQYDVTGALEQAKDSGRKNGFGSRSEVEPISCMLACNAAPSCDSFSYNPTQKRCFLKSGATRQTCASAPTVCVSARGSTYSCGVWQTYFKQQQAASSSSANAVSGQQQTPAAQEGAGNSNSSPGPASRASDRLAQAFSRP